MITAMMATEQHYEKKVKTVMVNNSTGYQQNNHLTHTFTHKIKRPQHMMLEIHVLASDRSKMWWG